MNFLSRVKTGFKYIVSKSFSGSGVWTAAGGGEDLTKVKAQVEQYRGVVYANIKLIAAKFSVIKLYVWDVKKEKRLDDHVMLDVLKAVNPEDTSGNLTRAWSSYMSLTGLVYWYVADAAINSITGEQISDWKEIYTLEPQLVQIKKDNKGKILKYIYQKGTQKSEYEPEEIIMFKAFNPKDLSQGFSPVNAIDDQVLAYEYAGNYNKDFFLNNAVPSGILKTTAQLGEEEKGRFKKEWNRDNKGLGKNDNLGFLSGNAEYQQISTSHKDLQFTQGMKSLTEQIQITWQVPMVLLGLVENTNKATAQEAKKFMAEFVTDPLMRDYVDSLNEKFKPKFSNTEDLEIRYEDPTPKDEELQTDLLTKSLANQPFKSVNEAREELDLVRIEEDWADEVARDPLMFTPTISDIDDKKNMEH